MNCVVLPEVLEKMHQAQQFILEISSAFYSMKTLPNEIEC